MKPTTRSRLRRALLASALASTAFLLLADARVHGASEPALPQVRLAYFPNLTHAAALVGVARKDFEHELAGKATLDVKTFAAGPALIEALFAGEVDVGYVGPGPAVNGFVKSRGEALRVIAGASSGGASFVVRPDAGITAAADLAGKTIATPQLGGTQDIALRYYLKQHGLAPADQGGAVTILPTQPADIYTLFKEGKIQGAWLAEPWVSRLVLEGGARVFVDERTQWSDGRFSTTVLVARKKFLDEHPDLVRAVLAGHVAAVRFVGEQPDGARRIVNAEIERITSKGLAEAVLDNAFRNTEITTDPLPATIQKGADQAFALGFLGASPPSLRDLYTLEPLAAVLAEARSGPVAKR